MVRHPLAILALAGLVGVPSVGSAQSVVQGNRANVYGVVQVNPTAPLAVRQTGIANVAGIIQAGPRNQAAVTQGGAVNRATIGQFEWQNVRGARAMMP